MPKNEQDQRLVSAWVPRAVAQQLAQAARQNERSISAELRVALREHLAAAPRERVHA
jgi:hypothetical protein